MPNKNIFFLLKNVKKRSSNQSLLATLIDNKTVSHFNPICSILTSSISISFSFSYFSSPARENVFWVPRGMMQTQSESDRTKLKIETKLNTKLTGVIFAPNEVFFSDVLIMYCLIRKWKTSKRYQKYPLMRRVQHHPLNANLHNIFMQLDFSSNVASDTITLTNFVKSSSFCGRLYFYSLVA